ncbi:MAG: cellobiose phosphorylase [Rhodospirillaceae bacterium]|nr:cellobiose phosphorylase [Rhodospirillaceae bacterium]
MEPAAARTWTTPRDGDLGLRRIANAAGLSFDLLPNGTLFAIEHADEGGRVMVNQVLGSPVAGGIGRVLLRVADARPGVAEIVGPGARVRCGAAPEASGGRFVWDGRTGALRHRVSLWLHPTECLWLWHVEVANEGAQAVACDIVLAQDLGLGERGFVMGNEAYAAQYIDHHIAAHPRFGPVVMSRQNLAQGPRQRHPWAAHGCLDGAAAFATDALQLFGPGYRAGWAIEAGFGTGLPGRRLQREAACAVLQSRAATVPAGGSAAWTFFALFVPDHPEPSGEADLARFDAAARATAAFGPAEVPVAAPARSLVQDARPLVLSPWNDGALRRAYPERRHEEIAQGRLVSFFVPDTAGWRHVVGDLKELRMTRRHGAILRSGAAMLPDEATLCATCWMHGVFAAQLTIGNTSFHKLFSVSRDPYNITRGSGLRMLADAGQGWRLLAVPSVFEMGLSDCRWLYRLDDRTIAVHAMVSGEEAAMQWLVSVDGPPCRFLVFGQLVLGEREFEHAGRVSIDAARRRAVFRPDPRWLWGERYPEARYLLVTSTPDAVDAIGGDELLYEDGAARCGGHVALRTGPVGAFVFAVVGDLRDPAAAERLAARYEAGVPATAMLAPAARYWRHVTRELRLVPRASAGGGPGGVAQADVTALDTVMPWLAHDAMVHLTVPHGLEQYTGAAWGTRDVCQGPVEFLLALEHDAPVRDVLRIVFAEQGESSGDWPQWFMLDPYAFIRDSRSHGDVIVWPLKALCDYIECTGDAGFLDETAPWRRDDDHARTARVDSIAAHVDKLLATVQERFVPGTSLVRYGEGDWNDSLQPADPRLRDWMVSSWTVALLWQQLTRYAEVLRRAGREARAAAVAALAQAMRADFHRHLVRDGTVAGYAVFEPGRSEPELLLHPSDTRTGLHYSLLPMTRGIIAGLFTPDQARHHLRLIREHLLFPDGVRLMEKPVPYRGGIERVFRRAESSAFFGREIGLMYVHAHLRYGEALAALGEAEALWEALRVVNPVSLGDRLPQAAPRQGNAYFSSSDAAFPDRYTAAAEWERVRNGTVPVEGGWRIYSSGPGLYTRLLLCGALGLRRHWGERIETPVLPAAARLVVEMTLAGRRRRREL